VLAKGELMGTKKVGVLSGRHKRTVVIIQKLIHLTNSDFEQNIIFESGGEKYNTQKITL
jgi:hypothetical protein